MFRKICLVGIISLITLSIFANQISYADDIDKIQPSWTEDLEFDTLKIFYPKITSLGMVQNGLNDLTELAYAADEHRGFLNK